VEQNQPLRKVEPNSLLKKVEQNQPLRKVVLFIFFSQGHEKQFYSQRRRYEKWITFDFAPLFLKS